MGYWTYANGETPMYRVGLTDRIIGTAEPAPEGFMVLNQTNNNTFVISGGVWIAGGEFPSAVLAAWFNEDGNLINLSDTDTITISLGITSNNMLADDVISVGMTSDNAPESLGPECYSQPTFTPAHDKWTPLLDLSFVGDVPTVAFGGTGMGLLAQARINLANDVTIGASYRFSITFANVSVGSDWQSTFAHIGQDSEHPYDSSNLISNGVYSFDFVMAVDPEPQPVFACQGTTGTFEIVSISLKEVTSGSSGIDISSYVSADDAIGVLTGESAT